MSVLIFLGWLSEPFLFLAATALGVAASSGPLPSGFSLEENFLFFLGSLLFPDSSGSLSGSPLWKDFFLLGRLNSASCLFKITANQLLLGKRFLFLGFGKREKPADCSGPRLFRHEGDTQNVQNVLEKRPAPVRARCRVITGLSQESWGRQLLLTVPPRDPQEPGGLRFPGWQGGLVN